MRRTNHPLLTGVSGLALWASLGSVCVAAGLPPRRKWHVLLLVGAIAVAAGKAGAADVGPGDLIVSALTPGFSDSFPGLVDPATGFVTELPDVTVSFVPNLVEAGAVISRKAQILDPALETYTQSLCPGGFVHAGGGIAIEADGSWLLVNRASQGGHVLRCDPQTGDWDVLSQTIPSAPHLDVGAGPTMTSLADPIVEPGGGILVLASGNRIIRVNPLNGNRTVVSADAGTGGSASFRMMVLENPTSVLIHNSAVLDRVDLLTGARTRLSSFGEGIGAGPSCGTGRGVDVADDGTLFIGCNVAGSAFVMRVDPVTGDRTPVPGLGAPMAGINDLVVLSGNPPPPLPTADPVPAGSGVTGSVLGGTSEPGGVEVTFPQTFGGTFEATAIFAPSTSIDPLLVADDVDFAIPTEPAVFWDLEYDGSFTGPVALTVAYDEGGLVAGFDEEDLTVYRFVPVFAGCDPGVDCGWIELTKLAQDLEANTLTVETPGFSEFGIGETASAAAACADGMDNDGDGLTDAAGGDPGCTDATDPSEKDETGLFPCDDGADNDALPDGRIDFDPVTFADPLFQAGTGDPGCRDPAWDTEDPACDDDIDNADADQPPLADWDGAGLGDPDPQCVGKPWARSERASCGLGAELVLVLPLLGWLRRKSIART